MLRTVPATYKWQPALLITLFSWTADGQAHKYTHTHAKHKRNAKKVANTKPICNF